tara:strand:- start:116 stop:859 length:744 start_codon:yes stop_codon:yes gene_type:complete
MKSKKGKFVVVDGIDGVGKGVFLDTFVEEAEKDGKKVFDVHKYWDTNGFHPDHEIIIKEGYDIILTSEPTSTVLGKFIRDELIAKNDRSYSANTVAEAYALDRRILYKKLLLPVLEVGIDVYQSRSYSSSIVYQHQSSIDEGKPFSIQDIIDIPGNKFCYHYPITHLVILTIADVQKALQRAENREKDDNCKFENIDFQLKIKERFEDPDFKSFFLQLGTKITYLDAGKNLEYSEEQAQEFYQKYLK